MMHPYQQPAPATLDIRLPTNGAWMIPMGFFAIAAGVASLLLGIFWGDLMALGGGVTKESLGFIAMGVIFPLMGGVCIWAGYRTSGTAIRVSMWGTEVTFEWRNGTRVVKTSRVSRSDVVEVVVTDAPSSGTPLYGLAVGMKNGEIALSNTSSSNLQEHWSRECRRLAGFLGVPARTP
jgi:hypothetical protein